MHPAYIKYIEEAKSKKNNYKKLLDKLKKINTKKLDQLFQEAHEEAFTQIDCLECANCCTTTSPTFYQRDIEKLAHRTKQSPSNFITKYLQIDQEADYVLKKAPCPFLQNDNCCEVYNSRPKACAEYPHTDRKKIRQILALTLKNSQICPAVSLQFKNIESQLKK